MHGRKKIRLALISLSKDLDNWKNESPNERKFAADLIRAFMPVPIEEQINHCLREMRPKNNNLS